VSAAAEYTGADDQLGRGMAVDLDIDLDRELERYRVELTGYCYRMLGGIHEAEDAVQEAMLRAWKNIDQFNGRSTLRAWLYRIATNVCVDMLRGRKRRALPMDLVEPSKATASLGTPLPEATWLQPAPDARVLPALSGGSSPPDPAEHAVARESIRLAFVAALQHLSPRQRAVVILRDVLRWRASEVAQLLDTTVVSVNSALQRGRSALAASRAATQEADLPADPQAQALLERYIDAFSRFDVDMLVTILHEDVTVSMPPYSLWLQGLTTVEAFFRTAEDICRHGYYVPATPTNGMLAVGHYKIEPDGHLSARSIQVVETSAGAIDAIHVFIDPTLFPLFDLPMTRRL